MSVYACQDEALNCTFRPRLTGESLKEGGGGGDDGDLLARVSECRWTSRSQRWPTRCRHGELMLHSLAVNVCHALVRAQLAANERSRVKKLQDDREKKAYDARVDKKVSACINAVQSLPSLCSDKGKHSSPSPSLLALIPPAGVSCL